MKASELVKGNVFRVNGKTYEVEWCHASTKKMTHLTCISTRGVTAVSISETLEVELIGE